MSSETPGEILIAACRGVMYLWDRMVIEEVDSPDPSSNAEVGPNLCQMSDALRFLEDGVPSSAEAEFGGHRAQMELVRTALNVNYGLDNSGASGQPGGEALVELDRACLHVVDNGWANAEACKTCEQED